MTEVETKKDIAYCRAVAPEMAKRHMNTWDVTPLQRFKSHFVFTYGTLKWGFGRHALLSRSKYQGFGETQSDKFEMCSTTGKFPVVLDDPGGTSITGRIKGELYVVPTEDMFTLDKVEGNGFMYIRRKVPIIIRRGVGQPLEVIDAWMYIGNPKYWSRNVDQLVDIEVRNGYNGNYYFFTKNHAGESYTHNYLN